MKELTQKPIAMFLALGFATTAAGCGASSKVGTGSETAETAAAETTDGTMMSHGGHEGGEGGEGDTTATDDASYMTGLALMKGHLMTAEELLDRGEVAAAEPHIGHPAEELYGTIVDRAAALGVAPFETQLQRAWDVVKTAPKSPEMNAQLKAVNETIDGAIAAIPAAKRESPEFVMGTVVQVLRTAAAEYEAAIVDGKFVEPIEYQDSRGFVRYATELFTAIADEVPPPKREKVEAALQELKTAWPEPMPPDAPVLEPGEVSALVSKIELAQ